MEESWTLDIEDRQRASCDPRAVMAVVLDPRTWPDWQSEIVETDGPVPLHAGAVVRGNARLLGFHVQGHSTTVEAEPGDAFEEDVIVGVRMRIRYEVESDGDGGAQVVRRLRADLPRGVAGRVLALFLGWRLKRMQKDVLRSLVRRSEEA